MIEVVSWGIGGSVRDAGRPGLAHLGRSRGGAVDPEALALANRIVGNPPAAAGFETSGGLVIVAQQAVLVAVAGAPCDLSVDDGPPLGWGTGTALPPGARVRVGRLHGGARTYLAVRGGLHRPGGAPADGVPADGAQPGDVVAVGADPGTPAATQPAAPRPWDGVARIWPGPRLHWFTADAARELTGSTWTVRLESDRVGARLDGPVLDRSVGGELPSEGLVEGALQVPPDGRPIVMLADHPVTGGYPVIAVVDPGDLAVVAQAAPGAALRFRWARPVARGR